MFANCLSLIELDIRNFDMTNVTNTSYIFNRCLSLTTLHLDNCSKDTVNKIISDSSFPADNNGIIYCKRASAFGLKAPGNWEFSYIDL
jgi:surface protein